MNSWAHIVQWRNTVLGKIMLYHVSVVLCPRCEYPREEWPWLNAVVNFKRCSCLKLSVKISMTTGPVRRDSHKRTLKDGKRNKGGLFFNLIKDMHENFKQHHSW